MHDALIWEELQRTAAEAGDRIALQSSEPGAERFTHRETIELARKLGHAFAAAGVRTGDRVALWSPVSPAWALAYLGVLSSGGVVVPLDAGADAAAAGVLVRATNCTLLVAAAETLSSRQPAGNDALSSLPVMRLDTLIAGIRQPCGGCSRPRDPRDVPATVKSTDVATIIFTSGTTGEPRGVVISHAAVSAAVSGMRDYMNLSPGDNVLAIVPSHHVFAPVGNLLVPLAAGVTLTYASLVSGPELLKVIRDRQITVFPSVPQVFYALHRRILDQVRRRAFVQRSSFFALLSLCRAVRRYTRINPGRSIFKAVHAGLGGSLRVFVSGGSYCDPAVIRDLDALGFEFQQGYGLTETFGGGTLTPAGDAIAGSVGLPLPGMQIRVVNTDPEGMGEIAISGPCVMDGYLHDPAGTAAVVRDGWFHTGDSGYLDVRGRLHVTGRRTDLIVLSSGKKVSPELLERHYGQSRAILEICVMGAHEASDYAGSERLHAVVVPDFEYLKTQGAANSREVIRSEIARLSQELPPYQRLLSYEVRSTPLPRTATRKIVRWQVASERSGAGAAFSSRVARDSDAALCRTESSRRLLELIRDSRDARRVPDPSMNLELDLGIDSLQRIELIATIEQAMGVRLPPDAVSQYVTVRDLLQGTAAQLATDGEGGSPRISPRRVRWHDILTGPEPAEVDEPVLRVHPSMSTVQFAALRGIRLAAAALFRFTVHGIENLPAGGPYLICPNHQSYLDGALVASALPYAVIRRFVALGWPAFFSGGVRTLLARVTNCVPIDPDTNLRRAMIVSAAALQQGKVVLIFPEGGLTWDGGLQPFKKGPAILAHEMGVPIVPVAITGTFAIWPKGGGGPRRLARVDVAIGRPIEVHDRRTCESTDGCIEQIARRLYGDIEALVSG